MPRWERVYKALNKIKIIAHVVLGAGGIAADVAGDCVGKVERIAWGQLLVGTAVVRGS